MSARDIPGRRIQWSSWGGVTDVVGSRRAGHRLKSPLPHTDDERAAACGHPSVAHRARPAGPSVVRKCPGWCTVGASAPDPPTSPPPRHEIGPPRCPRMTDGPAGRGCWSADVQVAIGSVGPRHFDANRFRVLRHGRRTPSGLVSPRRYAHCIRQPGMTRRLNRPAASMTRRISRGPTRLAPRPPVRPASWPAGPGCTA